MDESENEDYYKLDDYGSTEYWQEVWETEKKEKEEEEKRLSEEVNLYFKCNNPKCGYVIKCKEKVQLRQIDEVIEQYKKAKCPKCGNAGFKNIDKKEFEKLEKEFATKEKEKDLEEKVDKDKIEKKIKECIIGDVKDLIEDLTERLLSGKMSPKSFVKIFYLLAMNITTKYYKRLPGGADVGTYNYYRKIFLDLCDSALERYDIKEEAEDILQTYDYDIEENKEYLDGLYDAEFRYFVDDVKDAVLKFDIEEYRKECKTTENNIFKQELNMEAERKYQEDLEKRVEKRNAKREKRLLEKGML